jgi:benzoyl-CoA reductase subunit C
MVAHGHPAANIELVKKLIAEIKARPRPKAQKLPRIFVWGNEIDDIAFIKLIEESGAYVVMDDLCTGTRFFWDDVPETNDPLDGIVSRYIHTHCPRSYTPKADSARRTWRTVTGTSAVLSKNGTATG